MPLKEYALDLIGIGIGAGVSFTLYRFFKGSDSLVQAFKNIPELDIDSSLAKRTVSSPTGIVGCIRGIVRALDQPLQSVTHPDITGVVWKHTVKEHMMAQIMGYWMKDERTIDISTRFVPFLLVGKQIGVQISNPSTLQNIDLTLIGEKYEAASISLVDHIWGWMRGMFPTGTQETEEMLVEGSRVMAVGRVVSEVGGLYLCAAPPFPFVVTIRDKAAIVEDLEFSLPFLRIMFALGLLGTSFCCYRITRCLYKDWKASCQRRKEARLIEEARLHREAQERDLPESLMCVICCGLRDVVLMPCQHVCICGECSLRLNPRVCPVCRVDIEYVQPVFYS